MTTFWSGSRPLRLPGAPPDIVGLRVVGRSAFALTSSRRLYETSVDGEGEDDGWRRTAAELSPIDLEAFGERLACVGADGVCTVWDPGTGSAHSRIRLESASIREVRAGRFGALFVDDEGRLFASGDMPQVNVRQPPTLPTRVAFFEGRAVRSADVGDDFAAVAVVVRNEADAARTEAEPSGPVEERAAALVRRGRALLNVEVWTWGAADRGQLGTGDRVSRPRPALVSRLSEIGVRKIRCGRSHCAALALDGRAFLWGDDESGVRRVELDPPADRARDLACGDDLALVLASDGTLAFARRGRPNVSSVRPHAPPSDGETPSARFGPDDPPRPRPDAELPSRILASKNIARVDFRPRIPDEEPLLRHLSAEQRFLEETTSVHRRLIKPLLKRTVAMGARSRLYEALCADYADVMYSTATNALSLLKFVEGEENWAEVVSVRNFEERAFLYEKYSKSVCDALSIGGFRRISPHVEISDALRDLRRDGSPAVDPNDSEETAEAFVAHHLLRPLRRLKTYGSVARSMMKRPSTKVDEEAEPNLSEVSKRWDDFGDECEKKIKEAEVTKIFWESSGKAIEAYQIPERRFIRDSKSHPLGLLNAGRFSAHRFILFDDSLIHINGNVQSVHKLETLWIDSAGDGEEFKNAIRLITPEETIALIAPSSQEKNEWSQILQSQIKMHLKKNHSAQVPIVRTAIFTFTMKSQTYKDATYNGRWKNGKMHGIGRIEWPDGRTYQGTFQNNLIHGNGKMDIPNIGIYEGQWKDNLQNGFGTMKYCSGDIYEGYFKDGLAHGYGVRKQGDFTSVSATVYMGDWAHGVRQGYGVMDDIGKGEKYLGTWNDNKKQGCGIIVTLDGIYYEGIFSNDILTGHGIMIFEDGTHYEGEFRSAGVFSGKGMLTFSCGDKIEGNLNGAWNDGIKINNATLHMNVSNPKESPKSKPNSFGKLCVLPNQKWNGLFRQCLQQIGVPDHLLTPLKNHVLNFKSIVNNQNIWQNIAVVLSQANGENHTGLIRCDAFQNNIGNNQIEAEKLNMIPGFGQTSLTRESYNHVKVYLSKACDLPAHPLARLVTGCCAAFCTSYGGVRVHPLLLSHAVAELRYLTDRVYTVIKILFPALPGLEEQLELCDDINNDDDNYMISNGEVATVSDIVQPLLLPRVHSALHVLYALHHQDEDIIYWKRLLKWNSQSDITLLGFLGIDQKFWIKHTSTFLTPIKDEHFFEAIDTLQQLKTTFSPMEKLLVIKSTFQKMTKAIQNELGDDYLWTMDELFPIFHFVVIRARILQLGSEIHFIEDFMESSLENGELGIMFTTLKASYYQILQEKNT